MSGVAPGAGAWRVRIEPQGWVFEAAAGRSLRESAAQAGIELPTACRNGTCRECLCRRSQGEIRHAVPWPGLSADEKRDGWLLPCVAQPLSDLVLEVPRARRL